MKHSLLILAVLGAAVAVLASACGGGSGAVPDGAVAVVNGTEIPRAKLDELVEVSKKTYAAQKQDFPAVGTPEYRNIEAQYLAVLVQRETYEQEAKKLGVEVTDKEVEKEVTAFVKDRFKGNRKQFEKALAKQGFSLEAFRDSIHTSLLSTKLYNALTKDVEVPEADILAFYEQNKATQYSTQESRDVRHLLVAEKLPGDEDKVDFPKSKVEADRLYAELQAGADFVDLVKEHSDDPTAEQNQGKLTVSVGQTVPEFEKAAFALKQGTISRPVKTTFGYHLIDALSPLRKATTTPLAKVRASIRAQLLQERKTAVVTEWAESVREEYEGKVSYAAGLEPPELPEATDTETETGTE